MHRLLPGQSGPADEPDADAAYADAGRRPHPDGRPWVLVNMVASVDGGVTTPHGVSGGEGGLGGPGDRAVFRALRALADVVLVGAGTVRAEQYRPRPGVRLAVVTARAALDWTWPLWTDAATTVVTTGHAARDVPPGVQVLLADDDHGGVDLHATLLALGQAGHRVVLCEGGPSLNGRLLTDDLVDEVCLTVAPRLLAGPATRVATGDTWAAAALERWHLAHVLRESDELFLRYLRHPPADGSVQ